MVLKVLQVVQSYYPAIIYGGPIFSIHYACQALARQGVDIHVATTNANGMGKLDVETARPVHFAPNYNVHYYNDAIISRFSWDFTRHLWRDIKGAHVVHLQDVFSIYAIWTMLLVKLASKPVLISARGTFTPWGLRTKRPWLKKLWLMLLVRPFIGNTMRVAWHATSDQERDEILAQFSDARVHIVPNGLDCSTIDKGTAPSKNDYFAKFFPNAVVAPDHAQVLVGLGRLHDKKAFDVAIRAFGSIAETYPNAVLLIAGADDGQRDELVRLIEELGVSKRIALVGEVKGDDKIAFLKGADLFVFPSHGENFGMVALEALASGLPVVASRNTPWAELEANSTGLWVENTPAAFAEAIIKMLSRDLTTISKHARTHAAQYDLTVIAAEFKKIYKEHAGGGARYSNS